MRPMKSILIQSSEQMLSFILDIKDKILSLPGPSLVIALPWSSPISNQLPLNLMHHETENLLYQFCSKFPSNLYLLLEW